jgi:hypothetical protein
VRSDGKNKEVTVKRNTATLYHSELLRLEKPQL